jgi:adenosylcobinamide hydrolase
MKVSIKGVNASLKQFNEHAYLAIHSNEPLYTLNSSIWGGGFGYHNSIINRQVDKSYLSDDPAEEMMSFLLRSGEHPESTAGMLTAAYIRDLGYRTDHLILPYANTGEQSNLHVSSWVTVGLGNTARAGKTKDTDLLFPGTINIIVVIDGLLTESAMVNAVITATEAKTAVLQDLNIKAMAEDYGATGTTTDAVVIAATQRGRPYTYAGTSTQLGYLIGKTVYDATQASALLYLEEIRRSNNNVKDETN